MGTFHRFCARLLRQYAPLVGLERELHDLRRGRQPADAGGSDWPTSEIELTHATPEAIAHAISWAKNNLIDAGASIVPRRGQHVGGIVERVYPAYQQRLLAGERRRFRRPAAARGDAAAGEPRDSRAGSTSATATSWSTSIRTRTWRSTRSCGPCRSTIRTWPSRAIPTSRSTAGAART